jgi:6-methylsalicylate decarboxylase
MTSPNRIDVHQHVVPPFWALTLPQHGGDPSGWSSPDWRPESAIAFMDSQQIATGLLSLTAPSVVGWRKLERREMARRVNEYTAALVTERPDRFGNFATLPLPDIEGALCELAHASDVLHADGVVLLSNYEGKYLGDAAFEPLWAELDRRAAVIFVHPGKPDIAMLDGIPGPIVDYPFDTTRTAVQIVLNGVLDRYPNVKIILSHAGGFVPYASHRFAELAAAVRPGAPPRTSCLRSSSASTSTPSFGRTCGAAEPARLRGRRACLLWKRLPVRAGARRRVIHREARRLSGALGSGSDGDQQRKRPRPLPEARQVRRRTWLARPVRRPANHDLQNR